MDILKVNKIKNGEVFVLVTMENMTSRLTDSFIPRLNEYKIFKEKDKLFLYKDTFHITGKKHSGITEIENLSTIISVPNENDIKIDNTISLHNRAVGLTSSELDIKLGKVISIFEGDKAFFKDLKENKNNYHLYI